MAYKIKSKTRKFLENLKKEIEPYDPANEYTLERVERKLDKITNILKKKEK